MFYALTTSGRWPTDIPISRFITQFISSYPLQYFKVATPYTSKLKTSADVIKAIPAASCGVFKKEG